jgi:hypothetical protein
LVVIETPLAVRRGLAIISGQPATRGDYESRRAGHHGDHLQPHRHTSTRH